MADTDDIDTDTDTDTDTAGTRVPAIEGWFTTGDDGSAPALLGSRCTECGTYAFPAEQRYCGNPDCGSTTFDTVELSRRGRIWSYTDARYQPPPPYVAADPYVPFCLAAVELAAEKLVVMGQVVPGVTVDDLTVGDEVELVVDTLYSEDGTDFLVWKWRPVHAGSTGAGSTSAGSTSAGSTGAGSTGAVTNGGEA